ncbi:MAG: hypothetical protein GY858_00375 [Candidatus Omnitrophica bacterium]|nr:hypothetical protein [Candidatus Omnitrophota bacterium]
MHMLNICVVLFAFCNIVSFCYGEIIKLPNGQTVEGTVTEETNEYIKVEIDGVPLTYYKEDASSFDRESSFDVMQSGNDLVLENAEQPDVIVFDAAEARINIPQGWFTVSKEEKQAQLRKDEYFLSRVPAEMVELALTAAPILTAYSHQPGIASDINNPEVTFSKKSGGSVDMAKMTINMTLRMIGATETEALLETVINGREVVRAVYECNEGGALLTTFVAIVLDGDDSYWLEFTCKSVEYAGYKDDLEMMLASIEIK